MSQLTFCCFRKAISRAGWPNRCLTRNNFGNPTRASISTDSFRAPCWPKRMKAPPLESIVNGINLTPRHRPLRSGTAWAMLESLRLRQKKPPRKDKKDLRIFFKGRTGACHMWQVHLGPRIIGWNGHGASWAGESESWVLQVPCWIRRDSGSCVWESHLWLKKKKKGKCECGS